MPLSIRPFTAADQAALLPLLDAYAAEMRGVLHGQAATTGAAVAALLAADARAELLVAWQERAPQGFALFFDLPEIVFARRCGQLDDLFVLPAARGRGIARALVGAVGEAGHARGWSHLRWFVPESDRAAIALYERIAEHAPWRSYIQRLDPGASL
ncbi:GNAT family N-acetyltransferase [Roseomonas sp. M0104]|uniref:GNAT family N-acetyltransferase n=1 Tax=Teichococcus coralli TaxID=2545983 RepID=A0A845B663_9PROT|nr:GNAT family N-acetyltransferase [Pseudoroseomonas coralli]MXP63113.1 GNAT family N-acetyltransferase [Pseudoroseomonas coralli]